MCHPLSWVYVFFFFTHTRRLCWQGFFFFFLVWDRYLHVRKLVGYGGREIRGKFALSLIISLFLSLAYEPTDASLCILPTNYKASSLPCSNKKPLCCTNHCISLKTLGSVKRPIKCGVAWVCMLRLLWFIQLCVKKGLGVSGTCVYKVFLQRGGWNLTP